MRQISPWHNIRFVFTTKHTDHLTTYKFIHYYNYSNRFRVTDKFKYHYEIEFTCILYQLTKFSQKNWLIKSWLWILKKRSLLKFIPKKFTSAEAMWKLFFPHYLKSQNIHIIYTRLKMKVIHIHPLYFNPKQQ